MKKDPILSEAFKLRGMTKSVSEACGIRSQTISNWKRVPAKHVDTVARITGMKPYRLRPDLYTRNGKHRAPKK